MAYKLKKSDLIYTDYKWTAPADHDNPKIIGGNDHKELNRSEGYEMLYFMNSLMHTWKWSENAKTSANKLEVIIRTVVPSPPRTHSAIKSWIENNYKEI